MEQPERGHPASCVRTAMFRRADTQRPGRRRGEPDSTVALGCGSPARPLSAWIVTTCAHVKSCQHTRWGRSQRRWSRWGGTRAAKLVRVSVRGPESARSLAANKALHFWCPWSVSARLHHSCDANQGFNKLKREHDPGSPMCGRVHGGCGAMGPVALAPALARASVLEGTHPRKQGPAP